METKRQPEATAAGESPDAEGASMGQLLDRLEQMEFAFVEANETNQRLTQLLLEQRDQPNLFSEIDDTDSRRLAELEARLNVLQPSVAALEGRIAALLSEGLGGRPSAGSVEEPPQVDPTDLSPVTEKIAALQDAVHALSDRIGQSGSGSDGSALESGIDQILGQVDAKFSAMIDDHAPNFDQLRGLHDKIDALRSRPDPVLDLGPQQRSFAQFATVMSKTLTNFEAVTAKLSDNVERIGAGTGSGELSETLGQLTARLDEVLSGSSKPAAQPAVPDDLRAMLDEMAQKIADLPAARIPASSAEMIAQRKSFASFQSANKAILERFELAVDTLGRRFETLLQEIKAEPEASQSDPGEFEELQRAIKELSVKMATIPKVAPVIQAHQKSLMGFQMANQQMLERFETHKDALSVQFETLDEKLNAATAMAPVQAAGEVAPAPLSDDVLGSLVDLSKASLLLASRKLNPDEILAEHRAFLSDLRTVVGEGVALCLQEADVTPTAHQE